MRTTLFVLVATSILAGCASTPRGNAIADNSNTLRENEGVVVICRPSALVASAIAPDVLLNNALAADVSNGSLVEIVQPAGKVNVIFRHSTFNDPAYKGRNSFGIDTTVNSGQKRYLVMAPNLNSFVVLPIAGWIASGMSLTWQVAEADESVVRQQCGSYKPLRVRF
ncbi:MAG: DUF2846 domain-containing protein [Microcystis wesenbergii Mw_MB_S_20031200_S109D]|uniref:DUF2846 domain-containing protein n=1 Tax=Microcystis wesenbergii Mw_MB_S_20031200_S109D TaxID=2486241 RepID=A0A552M0X1_9CHRO|nr:MAG: DUF2846 domain-containing protein [Microcystis wesenbergii Mw_MB_S_20031200_S109D]